MSVYTIRYAIEKGAEIVCAFGRSSNSIGKDIGDIAGIGKLGVLVQDSNNAAAILKEKKPDACIIATASLMHDLKRPLMDCAESGVNAITLCEEAFYPWNSANETTRMLDELAKKNGVTLCGSGYGDVFLGESDYDDRGRDSHNYPDQWQVQLQRRGLRYCVGQGARGRSVSRRL